MNTEKKLPLLPKLPPKTLDVVCCGGPRGRCCCGCGWPLKPAAGLGRLWKRGWGGSPLNVWKGCAENCVEPGVSGGARTGDCPTPAAGCWFCWLKLKKEVEGTPPAPPEGSCTTLLLTCAAPPPNWGCGGGRCGGGGGGGLVGGGGWGR